MARYPSLRILIDLIEGKLTPPPKEWGVSMTPLFQDTLKKNLAIYPDLRDKLQKFIDTKRKDPLRERYGKHDRPFTGPLVGFWHAHLRDDAIIVYNLKDRNINLVAIYSHAEIEGKRAARAAKQISPYR